MQFSKVDMWYFFISTGCVLVAFFLGYIFCARQIVLLENKYNNQVRILEIQTRKNAIKVTSQDSSIQVLLNGKAFTGGIVELP